jgi:hypothetical protein
MGPTTGTAGRAFAVLCEIYTPAEARQWLDSPPTAIASAAADYARRRFVSIGRSAPTHAEKTCILYIARRPPGGRIDRIRGTPTLRLRAATSLQRRHRLPRMRSWNPTNRWN